MMEICLFWFTISNDHPIFQTNIIAVTWWNLTKDDVIFEEDSNNDDHELDIWDSHELDKLL